MITPSDDKEIIQTELRKKDLRTFIERFPEVKFLDFKPQPEMKIAEEQFDAANTYGAIPTSSLKIWTDWSFAARTSEIAILSWMEPCCSSIESREFFLHFGPKSWGIWTQVKIANPNVFLSMWKELEDKVLVIFDPKKEETHAFFEEEYDYEYHFVTS